MQASDLITNQKLDIGQIDNKVENKFIEYACRYVNFRITMKGGISIMNTCNSKFCRFNHFGLQRRSSKLIPPQYISNYGKNDIDHLKSNNNNRYEDVYIDKDDFSFQMFKKVINPRIIVESKINYYKTHRISSIYKDSAIRLKNPKVLTPLKPINICWYSQTKNDSPFNMGNVNGIINKDIFSVICSYMSTKDICNFNKTCYNVYMKTRMIRDKIFDSFCSIVEKNCNFECISPNINFSFLQAPKIILSKIKATIKSNCLINPKGKYITVTPCDISNSGIITLVSLYEGRLKYENTHKYGDKYDVQYNRKNNICTVKTTLQGKIYTEVDEDLKTKLTLKLDNNDQVISFFMEYDELFISYDVENYDTNDVTKNKKNTKIVCNSWCKNQNHKNGIEHLNKNYINDKGSEKWIYKYPTGNKKIIKSDSFIETYYPDGNVEFSFQKHKDSWTIHRYDKNNKNIMFLTNTSCDIDLLIESNILGSSIVPNISLYLL